MSPASRVHALFKAVLPVSLFQPKIAAIAHLAICASSVTPFVASSATSIVVSASFALPGAYYTVLTRQVFLEGLTKPAA